VVGIPVALGLPLLAFLDLAGLSPLGPWHYRSYHRPFYFDLAAPMERLGWKPRYDNVTALIDAYEWFLRHREAFRQAPPGSVHRRPVREGLLAVLKRFS
jgi:hypothetical protein